MSAAAADVKDKVENEKVNKLKIDTLLKTIARGTANEVESLIDDFNFCDFELGTWYKLEKRILQTMNTRISKSNTDRTRVQSKKILNVIETHFTSQTACILFSAAEEGDISPFLKKGKLVREYLLMVHPEDNSTPLWETAAKAGHTSIVKWLYDNFPEISTLAAENQKATQATAAGGVAVAATSTSGTSTRATASPIASSSSTSAAAAAAVASPSTARAADAFSFSPMRRALLTQYRRTTSLPSQAAATFSPTKPSKK